MNYYITEKYNHESMNTNELFLLIQINKFNFTKVCISCESLMFYQKLLIQEALLYYYLHALFLSFD